MLRYEFATGNEKARYRKWLWQNTPHPKVVVAPPPPVEELPPGVVYELGEPENVGPMPVRQDIEVLPADEPRQLRLGWVVNEIVGIAWVNPRAVNRLTLGGDVEPDNMPYMPTITIPGPEEWLRRYGRNPRLWRDRDMPYGERGIPISTSADINPNVTGVQELGQPARPWRGVYEDDITVEQDPDDPTQLNAEVLYYPPGIQVEYIGAAGRLLPLNPPENEENPA